ncbi:PPC domain-containing DNA-binding protein [Benzoatithermus flavus]|uniref:PPC domain-containing DNA-binding protein n=1 Tax=Benzoatithermus flavus TaxID=3108223 RepID=A0ABU8XQ42_9PROT
MKCRLLDTSPSGLRTLVAVFDTGDEVMAGLKELATKEKLTAAQLSAIGAFVKAELAYFDWDKKQYQPIRVDEQVEVASMLGDIGVDDGGAPALHVHLVLGRRDGSAVAGHLVEATVRPTLEVVITETPAHLHRRQDPATGLALIRF